MANNKYIMGVDEFKQKLEASIQFIENDAPLIIGVLAVAHFKEAFALGGLAGKKWADRKTPRTGSTNGQGVLIKSSDLMNSIDYKVQGLSVIVYSDLLYAEIHNEGGTITVTPKMKAFFWAKHYEMKENSNPELADIYKACALSKKITIEQRQFMGDDPALDKKITEKITKGLDQILKS